MDNLKYYYHPESDSYFTEDRSVEVLADGHTIELTREEYISRAPEHQS